MASATQVTHYELLDLPVTATSEEIKKAYRRCSREVHPDRGGNAGMFRIIQMAYDTLVDPVRRAEYDRIHLGIQTPKPEPKPQPKPEPKPQPKPEPKPGNGPKHGNQGSRSSRPRNSEAPFRAPRFGELPPQLPPWSGPSVRYWPPLRAPGASATVAAD